MKKCQPCGAVSPADAPHCARCGEASWFHSDHPAISSPPTDVLSVQPTPAIEQAFVYDVCPPPAGLKEMPPVVVEMRREAPPEPPVLIPSAPVAKHHRRGSR